MQPLGAKNVASIVEGRNRSLATILRFAGISYGRNKNIFIIMVVPGYSDEIQLTLPLISR